MGCVYRLIFPSGKSYIGVTKHTAEQRFRRGHIKSSRENKSWAVAQAIIKYGHERVLIETLFVHNNWRVLASREKKFIKSLSTMYPHGYNGNKGGGKNQDWGKRKKQSCEDAQ